MSVRLLALAVVVAGCGVEGPPLDCPSKLRPTARRGMAAVLDPATHQIYAFGGATAAGNSDELWRWSFGSCGGWVPITREARPTARTGAAAVLDAARHRVLVAGGEDSGEVWAFDTEVLAWAELQAANAGFTGRPALAAFDPLGDRLVDVTTIVGLLLFAVRDTGEWQFVTPAPPDRPPASAALDPTRSTVFKLDAGGLHGFALATLAWHDVAPSGDAPPAGTPLVWDATRRRLVAVGASVWAGELDANGTAIAWTTLPATGGPPPRDGASVVVDGDTVWLFGGASAACRYDDVWELDLNGDTWTNVQAATTMC